MAKLNIDRGLEPVRLFQSDILEVFTHITPQAILLIWTPVILFFFGRAAINTLPASWPVFVGGTLLGLFLWTFIEYVIHRFLFHFKPRNQLQERIIFMFHEIHHYQPNVTTRLVMPPIVSVPMAVIFYALFSLIFSRVLGAPNWIDPLMGSILTGYLAYDMIHYLTHHGLEGSSLMRTSVMKTLRRQHMLHHFKDPDNYFGVSNLFWDRVFGTLPEEKPRPDTAAGRLN